MSASCLYDRQLDEVKRTINFFISYLFYTHQCIHVNPNLPIHPTTTPPVSPLGVHTSEKKNKLIQSCTSPPAPLLLNV